MSQPKAKRQFAGAARDPSQRQITSFFNTDGRVQSTASTHEARGTGHGIGPALSSSIQSSLLSVGMRVRKSVPEGYKTGSVYSGYKMWSGNSSPYSKPTTQSTSRNAYFTNTNTNQIGLVPYCGVNKIGDLSTQPIRIENEATFTDIPAPSSSQETIDDFEEEEEEEEEKEEPRENKKRGFIAEDDFEKFPGFGVSDIEKASCGPKVKIVYPNRVMAIPRKSKQSTIVEINDFEEAPFLDQSILP